MPTPRQQQWLSAADEEARRGNEVAAVLFTLIGQPNERERFEKRVSERVQAEIEDPQS